MPLTHIQRLQRVLIAIAEDKAAHTSERLDAARQLQQIIGDKGKRAPKPKQAKAGFTLD